MTQQCQRLVLCQDSELLCVDAKRRYGDFYNSFNKYKWKKTNQHCGRFPLISDYVKIANIDIRVKHFGWSKEEDRIKKYKRYMQLDGNGKCGNLLQYESILHKNPHLELFEDRIKDYSDER